LKKFKKVLIFVIVLALVLTVSIFAAPGDSSDPIVVVSYLNQQLNNLIQNYKLENVPDMQAQLDKLQAGSSGGTASLEIVEINAGEKLICSAGTELILRTGEAFVIGNSLGDGISNITMGKNFADGMSFPKDNLLLIPRDDGRGAYTNDYALFMVRGEYKIIK